MCGFTGILRLGDTPEEPWGALLDRMTDSLESLSDAFALRADDGHWGRRLLARRLRAGLIDGEHGEVVHPAGARILADAIDVALASAEGRSEPPPSDPSGSRLSGRNARS